MIPRIAHFVFGLKEQDEPFHFVHYASIESCRRVLEPEVIYFHHKNLPWGPWWERIRPHVTLVRVEEVDEVLTADYSTGLVPPQYRYAHHADFIRLDALIAQGGLYADVDTIFVRPFPDELFEAPFVIGREPMVVDERKGERRPSLCNALLMSEPGSLFAHAWRDGLAGALNGTWSNHSGFLSQQLSESMPESVRVEPEVTFFSFSGDRTGIARLFEERHRVPDGALSVHLWEHMWWDRARRDFSDVHAGWCTPSTLRRARTTFADMTRPYLAVPATAPVGSRRSGTETGDGGPPWLYLSLDEDSGYGTAADRCRDALESSGLEVDWIPFVHGYDWGLYSQPPPRLDPFERAEGHPDAGDGSGGIPGAARSRTQRQVVVAHLVPEYYPHVRERTPDAFLVGHTAWETDRLPRHWIPCLDATDLVVVPSRFCAETIAASPVAAPVAVVPHVAPRTDAPSSAAWREVADEAFVFYTIGVWNERKAVFKAVEAYLRAFTSRDPVLLIVKTSPEDFRQDRPDRQGGHPVREGTSAWALARLIARHPDPPPVRLVTRNLAESDIVALHRRGDCFVSLSRGEGWGLGAFDAAAHGNPVVATAFGGYLDYLAGSPYMVEFDLVPVHDPMGFPSYAPDQRWAEPAVDHAAALLREVIGRPDDARRVGRETSEDIARRYCPEAIASAFRAAVDDGNGGRLDLQAAGTEGPAR